MQHLVQSKLSIYTPTRTLTHTLPCLQVSCLGLEENVKGDPNKFILSSCSTNGAVESFVLHSSHPGVREVWTLQISQILDSQHSFLNGRSEKHTNMEQKLIFNLIGATGVFFFFMWKIFNW